MISSRPFLLSEALYNDLVPVIVPVSILVVIGIVWTSLDKKSKNGDLAKKAKQLETASHAVPVMRAGPSA
jgi:hypothetical protein